MMTGKTTGTESQVRTRLVRWPVCEYFRRIPGCKYVESVRCSGKKVINREIDEIHDSRRARENVPLTTRVEENVAVFSGRVKSSISGPRHGWFDVLA